MILIWANSKWFDMEVFRAYYGWTKRQMSNQRRCSVNINTTLHEQRYMQHVRKPKAHKRRSSVIGFYSGVPTQQAHNFEMKSYWRRCDMMTSHWRHFDAMCLLGIQNESRFRQASNQMQYVRKRNRFRYEKYLVTFLRDCSMKLHKSILKFRLNKLK